ncbi:MAG: hypothetical protein IE909_11970 [Campylobacterales bacterium]|nr:hypothetical protein [Campylobacterales bacterium]
MKNKNGFAMIMAIVVIVILATIASLSLHMSAFNSKQNTELYLRNQIEIIASSAFKYTYELIQFKPCTDLLAAQKEFYVNSIYHVNIDVVYSTTPDCNASLFYTQSPSIDDNLARIDISVEVNDNSVSSEPIRYFKRFLQKI